MVTKKRLMENDNNSYLSLASNHKLYRHNKCNKNLEKKIEFKEHFVEQSKDIPFPVQSNKNNIVKIGFIL